MIGGRGFLLSKTSILAISLATAGSLNLTASPCTGWVGENVSTFSNLSFISASFCMNFFTMKESTGRSDMSSSSILSPFFSCCETSIGLFFCAYCSKHLICFSKNMAFMFECTNASIASAPLYTAVQKASSLSSIFSFLKPCSGESGTDPAPCPAAPGSACALVSTLLACESARSCFHFVYFALSALNFVWLSVLHSALAQHLEQHLHIEVIEFPNKMSLHLMHVFCIASASFVFSFLSSS